MLCLPACPPDMWYVLGRCDLSRSLSLVAMPKLIMFTGDERPCQRCIKRGLQDACQDGVRKKAKYRM
jgi:hypothetical protein